MVFYTYITPSEVQYMTHPVDEKLNIAYTNTISVDNYNALREAAGWGSIHPEQAAATIAGSAFIISATDGDKTVGTARVVRDGGYAALIKDVLVLPEYQHQGIGTEMMNQLMTFLRSQLKPGYGIQVDLMCAIDREPFYEKFGFAVRPRERRGAGMDMWITE
jgi:GNAT superfamily N-acetyltransferase